MIEKVLGVYRRIVDKQDMLLYTAARQYIMGSPLCIACDKYGVSEDEVKAFADELLEMERTFTLFDRMELASALRKHND